MRVGTGNFEIFFLCEGTKALYRHFIRETILSYTKINISTVIISNKYPLSLSSSLTSVSIVVVPGKRPDGLGIFFLDYYFVDNQRYYGSWFVIRGGHTGSDIIVVIVVAVLVSVQRQVQRLARLEDEAALAYREYSAVAVGYVDFVHGPRNQTR